MKNNCYLFKFIFIKLSDVKPLTTRIRYANLFYIKKNLKLKSDLWKISLANLCLIYIYRSNKDFLLKVRGLNIRVVTWLKL